MRPLVNRLEVVDDHPGVELGRRELLVAQELLDVPDRGLSLEHVGRAGVAQGVGCDLSLDPRLGGVSVEGAGHRGTEQGTTSARQEEDRRLGGG